MREFFDSSTLLAAMVEDEPGHEAALAALSAARDGYAATHSLAECFAILTGHRGGNGGSQFDPAAQPGLPDSR